MRVALPSELIGHFQRLARRGQRGRHPVRHDVVVRLVGCGQLHQLHAARSPVAQRLHPGAGAALVSGFHVFIAGEAAVALHQTEAARVLHGKRADGGGFRALQRAPQPFAFAADHHQTVGVVYFGAEVAGQRLVFTREEHAGERRDAQCVYRAGTGAQKDAGADRGGGLLARPDHEAVGAGGAWRFEQRQHGDFGGAGGGALQPELGEARELFARATHGVDREATRRQAVLLAGAECAEVACALKHHQLVLVGLAIERVVQAETGVAEVAPKGWVERVLAVVEVGTPVRQVVHPAIGHEFVDAHWLGLVEAEVEKLGFKRQGIGAPERLLGLEADVAQLVVGDAVQPGGQLVAVCQMWLASAGLGQLGQAVPVKALGLG